MSALRTRLLSSTVLQSPGFGFRPKPVTKVPVVKEITPTSTTGTAGEVGSLAISHEPHTLRRRPARGLRP